MYRSILLPGEARFTEKRSEFIGRAHPAETVQEAEDFIQSIREAEPRATHHCSCYIVGKDGVHQKYDDNGEPQGTAGIPMLEVLRKEQVTNLAVVVTRYFGGIKLGASGLVRAYTRGCREALEAAGVVTYLPFNKIQARFGYPYLGKLEYQMASYSEISREYGEDVTLCWLIPQADVDKVQQALLNLTSGSMEWKNEGTADYPTEADGRLIQRK